MVLRIYSLIVARGHITYPGLDRPVRTPLPTPAFSIKKTEAIVLALKAGLGLELCHVLMHALSWGALVTAGVSAVLVSQTSLGAIIQKFVLRIGGALLGGALGIATIVVAMPNLQKLGSLLIVAGLGFSSRHGSPWEARVSPTWVFRSAWPSPCASPIRGAPPRT